MEILKWVRIKSFERYTPQTTKIVILLLLILSFTMLFGAMKEGEGGGTFKTNDLKNYHNVGNIWLRVSNFGFFGAGSDTNPPWPSLEYPGGSGIDYLFQGALWFGAKKVRKNLAGDTYYWRNWPPQSNNANEVTTNLNEVVYTDEYSVAKVVVDTLVSVGFDGDLSLYELLPAYNPLEYNVPNWDYNNPDDKVITQSIRHQRRGVDDDGDGLIDEDQIGRDFRFRTVGLPKAFEGFAGSYMFETPSQNIFSAEIINQNSEIWFPAGFQDLGYGDPANDPYHNPLYAYNFARPHDDDRDGLIDEDGAPISEQDYVGYYYDYSPFGSSQDRDHGTSSSRNEHYPLGIFVRQMSFAWSYDYIKNLVYVEFDITNMSATDTLFDCVMGIYIDADCGPQSYEANARASEDLSGYVRGEGYEFAYSRDANRDGGLTPGYIGVRVCTPDPEDIKFSCWYWKVGDGPDDHYPRNYYGISNKTANEKYWLLTDRNPAESKYTLLRDESLSDPAFETTDPKDTRFLFAFYGRNEDDKNGTVADAVNGYVNPNHPEVWNLKPKNTMKIVVAVFPGMSLDEIKAQAIWAKDVYKSPQNLTTVVLPDTAKHYEPPEPPNAPRMYAELKADNSLDVYWDNRSEFSEDELFIPSTLIGWVNPGSTSGWDSDPAFVDDSNFPEQFKYANIGADKLNIRNANAVMNPFTGYRLRRDFQGYSVWGRSGIGENDSWMLIEKYDKIDSPTDYLDYHVNYTDGVKSDWYEDREGDTGFDVGLPQRTFILPTHLTAPAHPAPSANERDEYITETGGQFYGYYTLGDDYLPHEIKAGDTVYGKPLYNWRMTRYQAWQNGARIPALTLEDRRHNQLLFKHPDVRDELFLELVDDNLIPLPGHGGQNQLRTSSGLAPSQAERMDPEILEKVDTQEDRLSRRYYHKNVRNLTRGREYYSSVTAYNRGFPEKKLSALESGKDANMKVFFPGPLARDNMDNIYVVPNPYRGGSTFDGYIEGDYQGDRGRRLWFVNLPNSCNIQIYTLAGDLVAELEHNGSMPQPIITVSKAAEFGLAASGIHSWNLLSKNNQIIASGLYLFSVKNHDSGDVKVGKFAVIR